MSAKKSMVPVGAPWTTFAKKKSHSQEVQALKKLPARDIHSQEEFIRPFCVCLMDHAVLDVVLVTDRLTGSVICSDVYERRLNRGQP